MSFALKVNFLKGWPNPYVLDFISTKTAAGVVGEGMIAHQDSTGAWVKGVSAVNQIPCVIWNGGAGDGDHNKAFPSTATASQALQVQLNVGGIQGIAFLNPILFETNAYDTGDVPVFGDSLYAHTDGKLYVCAGSATVSNKVIVATVVKGVHTKPGHGAVSMITVVPDNSKRVTA